MDLINALLSIDKAHTEDILKPLTTIWGDELLSDKDKQPLPEYPRPQLIREDDTWISLNGWWEYEITGDPKSGSIRVPFSPEAMLSGVGRQLKPGEELIYRRVLPGIRKKSPTDRILLHFGAVDQQAWVYVNGIEAGYHIGGYLPFTLDITDYIRGISDHTGKPDDTQDVLEVRVRDDSETSYHSRGKQTTKRGGMYYTAQSGIWQTVWLEIVPSCHITDLIITPDRDLKHVDIKVITSEPAPVSLRVYDPDADPGTREDAVIAEITFSQDTENGRETAGTTYSARLEIEDARCWSPEEPWLYPVRIEAGSYDVVYSYFAIRSFTLENDDKGIPRFFLNHRPYFLNGVLDQGYWPDGLYTAPSDEAFIHDIMKMKELGFNMLRKHVKVEAARWYYHCDRLGMIVWQDMVSGGSIYAKPVVTYLPTLAPGLFGRMKDGPNNHHILSRDDAEGRAEFISEMKETIRILYNVPSIAVWVLFNEGWGQFNAAMATVIARDVDGTRLIDQASGWFDEGGGDFRSVHNYFRPLKVEITPRAYVISEYGGYACHIDGHSSVDRVYGYKRYDTTGELGRAYDRLMGKTIAELIPRGLAGAVYTQLSDVEEEVNGILTYDRRVCKISNNSSQND